MHDEDQSDDADADGSFEAISDLLASALPGQIVTNFVLVAETLDTDGPSFEIWMSDTITPWLALGLVHYAEQIIAHGGPDGED